jgi:hypothetical protein
MKGEHVFMNHQKLKFPNFMNPNPSRIPQNLFLHKFMQMKITFFRTNLMPPDRRLLPSGTAGAPTAPARARTPRRRSLRGTRGMDAHAGGRRAARLCRHQMAAGLPACTSTSPPLRNAARQLRSPEKRASARSASERGHHVGMEERGGRGVAWHRRRRSGSLLTRWPPPSLLWRLAPK